MSDFGSNLRSLYKGAFPNTMRVTMDFGVTEQLWEDKHLHWARAVGRKYAGDENALARFVVEREMTIALYSRGPGSPPGNAWSPAKEAAQERANTTRLPFAPKWLHALWDVMTERGDGGSHGCVTSEDLDAWAVRRAAMDEDFRHAIAVTYGEGGLDAVVTLLRELYAERHRAG